MLQQPQKEDNFTDSGLEDTRTVPEILGGEPMQVNSYDMAIYTPDGKKLWEQLDQPGLGGRGTQRIELDSNFTLGRSLQIQATLGRQVGMEIDMADSVTFTATIAPDFHLVTVLLAIGIIPTIAVGRYRRRLI